MVAVRPTPPSSPSSMNVRTTANATPAAAIAVRVRLWARLLQASPCGVMACPLCGWNATVTRSPLQRHLRHRLLQLLLGGGDPRVRGLLPLRVRGLGLLPGGDRGLVLGLRLPECEPRPLQILVGHPHAVGPELLQPVQLGLGGLPG